MHRSFAVLILALSVTAPCMANEISLKSQLQIPAPEVALSLLQPSELHKIHSAFLSTGLLPEKITQLRVSSYTSPHPDAFISNEGLMHISSGLLEQIHSIDELAFVLAHELAHQVLGEHSAHSENDADVHALHLLNAAGFNTAAAITLLNRVCSSVPVSMRSRPGLATRVTRLQQATLNMAKKSRQKIETAEMINQSANRFY